MGRLLDIAQAVSGTSAGSKDETVNLREKRNNPLLDPYCAFRAELNSELCRLHEYLIRLRCEDPPKGTREQAFAYQRRQIEKLAARSVNIGGTEDGWPDPGDDFADGDQLIGLRQALEEVKTGDYPLPLPDGCVLLPSANFDPFSADPPRYYSGKLIQSLTWLVSC